MRRFHGERHGGSVRAVIFRSRVCVRGKAACAARESIAQTLRAAQTSQNAQAGCAADYQCKRCAQCFIEVQGAKKGHQALADRAKDRSRSYIGHRHVTRICSDYYGKGIVRSNQESANRRAYVDKRDVTAAESIKTTASVMVPGHEAVRAVEREVDAGAGSAEGGGHRLELDYKDSRNVQLILKSVASLYAARPLQRAQGSDLAWLSLCEFLQYWRVEPVKCAVSVGEADADEDGEVHRAALTEAGSKKARDTDFGAKVIFVPSAEYEMRGGGSTRVAFPLTGWTEAVRYDWVLVRIRRQRNPTFHACPMPRQGDAEAERSAMILMTYFLPDASLRAVPDELKERVPHISELKKSGETWQEARDVRFARGVATSETRRYT